MSTQGLQMVSSVPNIGGLLAASKDGSQLVSTGSPDGTLRLFAFDAATGKLVQTDQTSCLNATHNAGFVAMNPSGDYVAASCDADAVSVFSTTGGKLHEIDQAPISLEPGGAAMRIVAAQ